MSDPGAIRGSDAGEAEAQSPNPNAAENTPADKKPAQDNGQDTPQKSHPVRDGFIGLVFGLILSAATVLALPALKNWLDPPNQSMILSKVCLTSGVVRGDWLGSQVDHPTARGLVATVALQATGFHDKTFDVQPDLLDLQSGAEAPVQLPSQNDIDARPIKGQAETIQRAAAVWQSTPTRPGRYIIRITVYDSQSATLRWATAYSPSFAYEKNGDIRLSSICSPR